MTFQHSSPTSTDEHNKRPRDSRCLPAQQIALGKDMLLNVQPIEIAFTLPHRYHERLLHDVRAQNPTAEILMSRRIGYLGSQQPVRYSLLAYQQQRLAHHIKVAGAALSANEAWTYNALIPLKDLGIGIAKILEHVAALPIHSAVPIAPFGKHHTSVASDSFCDTS